MPDVVSSHFAASGAANGFMSRGAYSALMVGTVVVVPLLVGLSGSLAGIVPPRFVNLPNREFWLSPERRDTTVESLSALCVPFALLLAGFLCFVHWLVVQANLSRTHVLSNATLAVGGLLFGVGTIVWLMMVKRRFSRVA